MFEDRLEVFLNSLRDVQGVDIMNIISSSKLRMITEEYQRGLDYNAALMCDILRIRQKKRNKAFLVAISEFLEECERKRLKTVFFKGIFLAADLYDQMENRISNDIDVIIDISDFFEFNKILEDLGYVHEFYSKESDNYEYYLDEIKQHHLGYIKEIDNETVHLEVHTTVVNPASMFENITNEFVQNSSRKELLGLKPFVLDVEYNLIALTMHFFKHLPLSYFQNMLFQRAFDVNLSNIHDIALYVYKYRSIIVWEKVLGIAKRMKVVKYFYWVATFVNKIYGEIFESDALKMFAGNLEASHMSYRDSEEGGLGKFLWLFDIYIDYCFAVSPKQFLLGRMAEGFRLMEIGFGECSEFYSLHKEERKSIVRTFEFGLENDQNKKIRVDFFVTFSTAELAIHYHVNNKECCPLIDAGEECYRKDGIEIIVIKDNCVIHRMLTIQKKNEKYSMVVYSNNTESIKELEETKVVYNLDVRNNGFEITVHIPWSFLDVYCDRDRRFLFNIAGLISNSKTGTQERACNIFSPEKTIWDFRGINGIEFLE